MFWLLFCFVLCCGGNLCQCNFHLTIFYFFWPGQTHPLNDPLFHFSTSRFRPPRLSSPLPCASFPSTYPATAEINLRPASTAFTNMCPGRLQTIFERLIFLYFLHNDAVFCLSPGFCPSLFLNSRTLVHLQVILANILNGIVLNCIAVGIITKISILMFDGGHTY